LLRGALDHGQRISHVVRYCGQNPVALRPERTLELGQTLRFELLSSFG